MENAIKSIKKFKILISKISDELFSFLKSTPKIRCVVRLETKELNIVNFVLYREIYGVLEISLLIRLLGGNSLSVLNCAIDIVLKLKGS